MLCENNVLSQNCCVVDTLNENLNSVVTIYTDCFCFTGLLLAVTECACKLITRCSKGCPPSNNVFGKVTVIPLCKIDAVTLCNTSS